MIALIQASRHSSMLAIFLLFLYVARTQATYYVDDRNNSILYSTGNSWAIDYDQGSFNQTLTFSTSQTSWMVIPFTGSGITLYVAHDTDLVNVSVMIDGNQNSATTTTIPPKKTGVETYNVSIYDIQILSFDLHNVSVHILSGALWFDFAAVNDTKTGSPASESSHSHSHLGAIIGGVVGGLAVLAAMMTLVLCIRKRIHKPQPIEQNLELKPVADSASVIEDRSSQHLLMPYPYTAETMSIISSPPDALSTLISTPSPPSSHDTTSISPEISTASANTGFSSNPLSLRPAVGETKRPPVVHTPLPPSSGHMPSSGDAFLNTTYEPMRSTTNALGNASGPPLTDEQVDFVNGLWRANVSAADIARVIERMRSEEAGRDGVSESSEMGSDMNPSIAPPRYDGTGIDT